MASALPMMDNTGVSGQGGGSLQPTSGVPSPGMLPVSNGMMPMNMNVQSGGGQISLSVLIDFMVQRAYHDLVVLGELLPRKTDMERKVEVFNYSSRTRMLFVRLLALVKWAGHASKVDKCNSIQMYLDRQSGLLTETADSLARMARETLVRATLPNFHLPAAVEVLTTGSYSRVPRCIRDRIVPPEPISASERRQLILRLNQIIEHRLVTSPGGRPSRMHPTKIENGRVTFIVENEFQASLTLLSDTPNSPWQLLDITILVQDKDTGEGRSLVHRMQVGFIKQVVQSQLLEGLRPLHGLYIALHCLCQSLQLEVLYNQAQKLVAERLGDYIRIEEYKPGACLTVSYWRELVLTTVSDGSSGAGRAAIQRFGQAQNANNGAGFCFSVQVDQYDLNRPLTILHTPTLTTGKEARAAEQVIRGGLISLERILVHSIYIRTRARLADLRDDLQQRLGLGDVEPTLHGSPAVLSIPILQPCLRSEQLLISVDTHSGSFLAHVPQYENNPFINDIQVALNSSDDIVGTSSSINSTNIASNNRGRNLEWLVSQLRYWITKQRVHKTLQHLPATSYEQLPVLFDLANHPLKDTSQNRMYIRLHHQSNAVLITDCKEKDNQPCEMDYRYHLLWVKPASIEDDPKDGSVTADIPKVYLKALSMIEFDPFLITHATATKVDVQDLSEKIIGKRKFGGKVEAPIKRTKYPAYFLSDLAHVVAFADERIPFMSMGLELNKRGVIHGDIEIQDRAVGLVIKLIKFPRVKGVSADVANRFEKYLMSASIRMQQRGGRFWRVEFVFYGNPVSKIRNGLNGSNGSGRRSRRKTGEKSCRKTILFTYEVGPVETLGETADNMLKEWSQMVHLFAVVDDLEAYLQCESINISNYIGIKTYSFKEVTLEYGPTSLNARSLARITWDASKSKFVIIFGGDGAASGMCPHLILKDQLEEHLNHNQNLALLGKILHETYVVALALSRLPTTPQVGVTLEKVKSPVQTFSVIPQSPTHFKVIFYNMYCLDINARANGLVCIR
jgi:mediator of RNA polymerase II transcription subunit 14